MSSVEVVDHRPYPLDTRRWVMAQRWHDLLFAHWRLDPALLQSLLPPSLEISVYDGSAWLGIVPFVMAELRGPGKLGIFRKPDFLELNVRTYVNCGNVDGVYFFSLDASSRAVVAAARGWFHLPYFNARMGLRRRGDWIDYRSIRTHRRAASAGLAVSYRPTGPARSAAAGTLDHWLVERYRLIVPRPDGAVLSGDIHHGPWDLQPAEVSVHDNTMTDWLGVNLDRPPDHVRFARFQDVYLWRPRLIGDITEKEDGTQ